MRVRIALENNNKPLSSEETHLVKTTSQILWIDSDGKSNPHSGHFNGQGRGPLQDHHGDKEPTGDIGHEPAKVTEGCITRLLGMQRDLRITSAA